MQIAIPDLVRRTRQHHAIEHATIHLLAARHARLSFSGLSDPWGFTLYGDVSETAVRQAVSEALLRLQAGEEKLAIHPNCGTMLVTKVVLGTIAAMFGTAGNRHPLEKVGIVGLLMLVALFIAQPLGLQMQRYTTDAAVTDRWLVSIEPLLQGKRQAYRVTME